MLSFSNLGYSCCRNLTDTAPGESPLASYTKYLQERFWEAMVRRNRSALMGLVAIALVACAVLPTSFVQPKPPRDEMALLAPAALGAMTAMANTMPAEALKGPLTGTIACTANKFLKWVIYPLCDPIFLVSPLYLGPVLLAFWAVVVTVIQLLIPATQPDEELR